jgi:hypothetical protein
MNPGKLGLIRRSNYSSYVRTRNRRAIKAMAGLGFLLIVWLASDVRPKSVFSGFSSEPETATEPETTEAATSPPADSAGAKVASKHTRPSLLGAADAVPAPNVPSGQAEPDTESAVIDESAVPEEAAHVPFLQSVMASAGPGAARFGYRRGPGAFGGNGGFPSIGFGGGIGGAVIGESGSTLESESPFGDTGSDQARLLDDHALEDTSIGDSGSSNSDDSNNSGSSIGGSNNGGSSSGDSNNSGSSNSGSSNGGSNNSTSNDDGSKQNDLSSGGSVPGDSNGGGTNGDVPPQATALHNTETAQVLALDVPEPGLMLLTGVGLAAVLLRRRGQRG